MFDKEETYDLELVGVVNAYRETEDYLRIEFTCTNKEAFVLRFPPVLNRIPLGKLVRVWAKRVDDQSREQTCLHWEDMES